MPNFSKKVELARPSSAILNTVLLHWGLIKLAGGAVSGVILLFNQKTSHSCLVSKTVLVSFILSQRKRWIGAKTHKLIYKGNLDWWGTIN